MSLTDAVIKDIKNILNEDNMRDILEKTKVIYKESIEELNSEGKNPNGKQRQSLSHNYAKKKLRAGKNPIPNFFLTGTARESLNGSVSSNDLSIFYRIDNAEVNKYMYAHEVEDLYGKERRQFPIEADSSSAAQKENINKVGDLIRELLMSPRQLPVPTTNVNLPVKIT